MSSDLLKAVDVIKSLGFTRILTSGGESTALEGAPMIRAMVNKVKVRTVFYKSSYSHNSVFKLIKIDDCRTNLAYGSLQVLVLALML